MARVYREWEKMGKAIHAELIKRATILGEKAMNYAFEKGYASHIRVNATGKNLKGDTLAWTDVTGNLRDSFASAVYIDGVLQKETVRYLTPTPTATKGGRRGRQAADDYLNKIHPYKGKNTIAIIVVAAMQYTAYLEQGRHMGGYKIRVVSGAKDYINKHYQEMIEGVYKRWNIKKPLYRVVKGDVNDPYFDYVPPKGKE